MKVYTYKGCSTCRDAVKWLQQQGIAFEELPIRETPPSVAELQAALDARGGNLKSLCNTSGMDYRDMGLKDKLPGMKPAEVLALLSKNGNLVKRPFVIDGKKGLYLSGFKEAEWKSALS